MQVQSPVSCSVPDHFAKAHKLLLFRRAAHDDKLGLARHWIKPSRRKPQGSGLR